MADPILDPVREMKALTRNDRRHARRYWLKHVVLSNRAAMARTRALRDSEKERDAFVFAAGPSMRKLDPRKVAALQRERGFHVFGINMYSATPFGKIATPDCYVWSDPAQWTQKINPAELAHLSTAEADAAQAKFRAECEEVKQEVFARKPKLFVPVDRHTLVDYDRVFPFCDAIDFDSPNVSDITKPLGYRSWTAYKALSIACWLGYRRIYLCGVDHDAFKSMVCDAENVKRVYYEHFYDGKKDVQELISRIPVSKDLFYTALTFLSLEKFAAFPIVNLDPTGLVDCFPKQHDLDVYV